MYINGKYTYFYPNWKELVNVILMVMKDKTTTLEDNKRQQISKPTYTRSEQFLNPLKKLIYI